MSDYPVVEIEWFDAQSGFGNPEHIADAVANMRPVLTHSIGYLLNEDDQSVLLGFMLFGDEMVKHDQLIPKGMIISRSYLSRKRHGRKKR